jgi:hypothetical protein
LEVVESNREDIPFLLPWVSPGPLSAPEKNPSPPLRSAETQEWKGKVREKVRKPYLWALRALRLVPKAELVATETRLRQEIDSLRAEIAHWTQEWMSWGERVGSTVNRMWAWPDNVVIVCRKRTTRRR